MLPLLLLPREPPLLEELRAGGLELRGCEYCGCA